MRLDSRRARRPCDLNPIFAPAHRPQLRSDDLMMIMRLADGTPIEEKPLTSTQAEHFMLHRTFITCPAVTPLSQRMD